MDFIFFGSSEFSKVILEGLCREGLRPKLVVSKPDKPKGRGLKVSATEVSTFAKRKKIPLAKPNSLKDKRFINQLKAEAADFFIVIDYGNIIPAGLLSLPKEFTLGLHPSLLPRYRGPAPIEYALLNGDKKTGLTIFKVNEQVDSGDIILQKSIEIDLNDDHYSLSRKLANEGADFLIGELPKIKAGKYKLTKQIQSQASFTAKFKKADGKIDWRASAEDIRNLTRAIVGWPSAYTYYEGLLLKIIKADALPADRPHSPGEVVKLAQDGIYVATGEGILRISRLQPRAKNVMDAWAFVCGHRLRAGMSF